MKTTERFEKAVTRLYKAFHNDTLNAFSCQACAVGSIVESPKWHYVMGCSWDMVDFTYIEYSVKQALAKNERFFRSYVNDWDVDEHAWTLGNKAIEESGYSPYELACVEHIFLRNFPEGRGNHPLKTVIAWDKDRQFTGLCAVIEYLAKLDNIPNPMDYSKVFEREDDKPKYELKEVF